MAELTSPTRYLDRNILNLIGNTPLVPIRRLNPNSSVTILAKMECFNPGGSIKDRIALSMIEGAEKRGELTQDKIVLEASSGNTGIGLAMVCAVKGYRCLIAMSEAASMERRQIMKAYGAEIHLTPARLGTDGAIEAGYELARNEPERYFCTDQFNNPDNWKAHYRTTADEIWNQTGGKVTTIVSTMGTTGTLMGITKRFRELNPAVKIIGGEPHYGHRIQGLKNMKESYRPGIYDKHLPDEIRLVHDDEAFEMTRKLAREEGLFVGMSSGAAMSIALRMASEMESGLIVAIFPDGGERYLSTGVFTVPQAVEPVETESLRLTNTLSRQKEPFEPIRPGTAGIYSCGPTAYEFAHLGLCRRLVVADLLKRTLEYQDYKVKHVMNITDIDDKTIQAAFEQDLSLENLTRKYTRAFLEDVETLRVRKAAVYPLSSKHVDQMINIARQLEEKGFAYEKHGSVYFDISRLSSYGSLSKVDLSKIDIGRTVDLDDYDKDSPKDFTLFKRVTLDELKRGIGFDSPWGKVRPGWHIECVAMSMEHLGEFFDIHTSGCDLIFPHHENEIAIATALTGMPLAKLWLHSELVFSGGKKMSRSEGNVVTLRDLLDKGHSGRDVRFFLLRTHYRRPLQYSGEYLRESVKALKRIDNFISDLISCMHCGNNAGAEPDEDIATLITETERTFFQAVNDDLNIPRALGAIYQLVRSVNPAMSDEPLSAPDAELILDCLSKMDSILGVLDISPPGPELAEEITRLVREREDARSKGEWDRADELRDRLSKLGVEVMDSPRGPRWRWTART